MTDRVNKKMPYEKEGVFINSKLDELMMQYYRVPSGSEESALHIEAFEVGQKLQYYFLVHSTVIANEILKEGKLTLPDVNYALLGLEAPFTLMLDNEFFQNNFQALITSILNELTRMNSSRSQSDINPAVQYSLSLCKWEYLSTIALLCSGTAAQKNMDLALRKYVIDDMDAAIEQVRKIMSDKVKM